MEPAAEPGLELVDLLADEVADVVEQVIGLAPGLDGVRRHLRAAHPQPNPERAVTGDRRSMTHTSKQ
jgi:hypothetical protein